MSHILRTSTEHITAPLADGGNYAYCQSRGAHNIKHIEPMEISIETSPQHWKLALGGHVNTDARTRDRTRNFLIAMRKPLGHKTQKRVSRWKSNGILKFSIQLILSREKEDWNLSVLTEVIL